MKKNRSLFNFKKKKEGVFKRLLNKKIELYKVLLLLILVIFLQISFKGGDLFKASLLVEDSFDGTVMPIKRVPNWVKTGGRNDLDYNTYATSQLQNLPKYDAKKLKTKCTNNDKDYINECITYSVVYAGDYKFTHTEGNGSHMAIDIRAPKGTPVYAIANGVITKAKYQSSGFGNHVVIKHTNIPIENKSQTIFSTYSHLSKITISGETIVKKGDLIGYVGKSGTATTSHLHFQIDKDTVSYHPWWPFTGAEASNAGLSFWDGINNGLGQEKGFVNTINPMTFVQNNLNYNNSHSAPIEEKEEIQDQIINEETLKYFSIISKDKIKIGERLLIEIKALDKNKNIIKNYNTQNLEIEVSNTSEEYNVDFKNGIGRFSIVFSKLGKHSITVQDKNTKKIKNITVIGKEENIANNNLITEELATKEEEKIETKLQNNFQKIDLNALDNTTFINKKLQISLILKDEKGITIKNPVITESLEVVVEGNADVTPKKLNIKNFKNGAAKLILESKEKGENKIYIKGYENFIKINVIEKLMPVVKFEITNDEKLLINQENEIIVRTIDQNNQLTQKSFFGEVKLATNNGDAILEKNQFSSSDFKNGELKIKITPKKTGELKITAKSGAIVGELNTLVGETINTKNTKGNVFTDVNQDHKNYKAIKFLKDKKIINGNPDGSFKPNDKVNRAEIAKMITIALQYKMIQPTGEVFIDVSKEDWFAKFAELAASEDLVKGYPDGSFGPSNNINRAEMFTILVRYFDKNYNPKTLPKDVKNTDWFSKGAGFVKDEDLLDIDNNNFEPSKKMTRGEIAESIYRFLHI